MVFRRDADWALPGNAGQCLALLMVSCCASRFNGFVPKEKNRRSVFIRGRILQRMMTHTRSKAYPFCLCDPKE
jgi:hypothetical protein